MAMWLPVAGSGIPPSLVTLRSGPLGCAGGLLATVWPRHVATKRAARSSRLSCPYLCCLRSAWSDQRDGGDVGPFVAVYLQVVDNCDLSLRQPDGRLVDGENRVMVVVGRVSAVLEVLKGVREYLGSRRELLAVPLKFSPRRSVVKAAVYAGPCCCGYTVLGRANQGIGVAGG